LDPLKNGAPGEIDSSVGRQLCCLVTASQFRLSVDHIDLGSLVTPSGRLRRLSSLRSSDRTPDCLVRSHKRRCNLLKNKAQKTALVD